MPRLPLGRPINAAIVIFWVVMTTLLVYRHYGPEQNDVVVSPAPLPGGIFGERWLGIYYGNEKIGYSCRTFLKTADGYTISEKMKMRIRVMGLLKDIELQTSAGLGADLALDSFVLSLKADSDLTARGKVQGRNLHVVIETAGTKSEQNFPLKERPLLDLAVVPDMLRDGLTAGKRRTMTVIDPATLGRQEMSFEVVGKERIRVMNQDVEAIKINGSAAGEALSLWVTANGEVLREESPMGFVLVAEPGEEAIKSLSSTPDITDRSAVPFNMKLPENTSFLRVRLSGIDFKNFDVDGGRQSLRGDVLEIRREDLKEADGYGDEAGPQGEYLADTMFIQSKNPAIIAAAKNIVENETNRMRAGRLICSWVYVNVRKEPSITVPSATEVLKTMRGDCNEHTTLYVALARAAGIPSRIALGLVYGNGSFYYHSWPEIYAGRWIAVDPTLGQFPADAAHIRIITGGVDKQARIAAAVGKIKVEGLKYR